MSSDKITFLGKIQTEFRIVIPPVLRKDLTVGDHVTISINKKQKRVSI